MMICVSGGLNVGYDGLSDIVGKMLCRFCSGVHCVVYQECASKTSKVGVANWLHEKLGLDTFFA